MKKKQKEELIQLARDLKPYVKRIKLSTDSGDGEIWLSAWRAVEELKAFLDEIRRRS